MAEDCLLVRHLPKQFSEEDKSSLLRHFGARDIRFMSSNGSMRHCAFASFANAGEADKALRRLHQLKIFDRRLVVEYAKSVPSTGVATEISSRQSLKRTTGNESVKFDLVDKAVGSNLKKIQDGLHHIAPLLGLNYPPDLSLRYSYPPPNPTIIANISHALAAVPKIYVQVLHLMNKMNLPPPFGPLTPPPPLINVLNRTQVEPIQQSALPDSTGDESIAENDMILDSTSEEESEIESDEEYKSKLKKGRNQMEVKTRKKTVKSTRKRPRIGDFKRLSKKLKEDLSKTAPIKPSEVFELPLNPVAPKTVELKLTSITEVCTGEKNKADEVDQSGFGIFAPLAKLDSNSAAKQDQPNIIEFITDKELDENRISTKDFEVLPVFKGYNAGSPSTRLYLKNVSKQVEEENLRYVYGRYVNFSNSLESNAFDIRLMKEGRMKGQAFVTLPNVDKARAALKDTNGYILQGKPLVVQFARSAKVKDP